MEQTSASTFAEDLLLVLFQPDSGTIAGEGILSDVLAGAVVAELVFNGNARLKPIADGEMHLEAVKTQTPSDSILRQACDYVSGTSGSLQPVLDAIGPALRQPLLERLVARDDIREQNGKVLGVLKKTTLKEGGSGRRSELVGALRDTLVDGAEPTPRIAALAASLWSSATLQQLDPVIPWDSAVIARAGELARGAWSHADTDQDVRDATSAMIAIIVASAHLRSDRSG